MILYSWNINGYRAILKKNYRQWMDESDADVICLQETKVHPEQLGDADRAPEGWMTIWNPSKKKKGYSGVAAFCRRPHAEPLQYDMGLPHFDYQGEGRLIHLEYEAFHLCTVYFPNGQRDEERLAYKLGYYDAFLEFVEELRQDKPIVVCGDFNTAHTELDLARPKENAKTSGFLPIERAWLDTFVDHGYVDAFRLFESDGDQYTWWNYRTRARERNVGWRIDYFFISEELVDNVARAWIENDIFGSDHCPVGLELVL